MRCRPAGTTHLSFVTDFPVAKGENVLHRTDAAVEAIASYVLEAALDPALPAETRPGRRCAVVRTAAVTTRTTLLLVRYRFHLSLPSRSGEKAAVAEDVAMLAYATRGEDLTWLQPDDARSLLDVAPSGNLPDPRQYVQSALARLPHLQEHLEAHGNQLAGRIKDSHRRVRAASGAALRALGVRAESPPDVLGMYVFVPVPKG